MHTEASTASSIVWLSRCDQPGGGGCAFPVDNVQGRILGKVLGEYFVYLCVYTWKGWNDRSGTTVKPWHYGESAGRKFDGDLEFDPVTQPVCAPERRPRFYKYDDPKTRGGERAVSLHPKGTRRAPILKKLFEKAQEECAELGIPF